VTYGGFLFGLVNPSWADHTFFLSSSPRMLERSFFLSFGLWGQLRGMARLFFHLLSLLYCAFVRRPPGIFSPLHLRICPCFSLVVSHFSGRRFFLRRFPCLRSSFIFVVDFGILRDFDLHWAKPHRFSAAFSLLCNDFLWSTRVGQYKGYDAHFHSSMKYLPPAPKPSVYLLFHSPNGEEC